MITPSKCLNLNICVLRAAGCLLTKLQNERLCKYEELRSSLDALGADADVLFLPTLHFLFL